MPSTPSVVVADDHQLVRAAVVHALTRAGGVDVIGEASNGSAALELIRTLRPDVAVLDFHMPYLSGIDVARSIRRDPALAATRLVLLSSSSPNELRGVATAAGIDRCLSKLVDVNVVACVVRSLAGLDPPDSPPLRP